jgi:hypothetical protein
MLKFVVRRVDGNPNTNMRELLTNLYNQIDNLGVGQLDWKLYYSDYIDKDMYIIKDLPPTEEVKLRNI